MNKLKLTMAMALAAATTAASGYVIYDSGFDLMGPDQDELERNGDAFMGTVRLDTGALVLDLPFLASNDGAPDLDDGDDDMAMANDA